MPSIIKIPMTLYCIDNNGIKRDLGLLSNVRFKGSSLPEVITKALNGIIPPLRDEELRHIIAFDLEAAEQFCLGYKYKITVGDYFLLRIEEIFTCTDLGLGGTHWEAAVSPIATGGAV